MKNKQLIYQVFVRNFSNEGTFEEVTKKLDYIESLGTDVLYLMPIHPIGVEKRKGTFGSPYAIIDFFGITPDYGSLNDFKTLISETHKRGMKLILDMVFHHTSPDNPLLKEHPEYYFYKDGKTGNAVGDWSDIIDLETSRPDTQEYLLSVLRYWVSLGVDGFRFDVASMIAFSFFKKARKALGPEIIFFAESIDFDFARYLKTTEHPSTPDEEMYPTFDYLYNYNYFRVFEKQVREGGHAFELAELMNDDLNVTPMRTRVHCLENHDVPRFARFVKDPKKRLAWMNITSTLYGHMFLYAGQELGSDTDVPLFEKQPVDWNKKDEETFQLYKKKIAEAKGKPAIIAQKVEALDGNTLRIMTTYKGGEASTIEEKI